MPDGPEADHRRAIEEAIEGVHMEPSQREHFRRLMERLEGEPRDEAMVALKDAFKREVTNPDREEMNDDRVLLAGAIAMCLGFVHGFEQEVERFRRYLNMMDRAMNPHRYKVAAQETYAVTNNHNLGKAVLNAVDLKALLFGGSVSAPPQLVDTYPELKDLALVPES